MSDSSEPEYSPSIWERSTLVQFFVGVPPESGGAIPDYAIGDGLRRGLAAHTCRRLENTPDWPGPMYRRPLRRLRDVSNLLGALAAIARAKRPLEPALESMLREEMRGRFSSHWAGAWVLVWAAIAAVLLFGLALVLLAESRNEELALIPAYIGTLIGMVVFVLYIRRGHDNPRLEAMVALHHHLSHGDALSEAMRRLRRFFPQDFVELVAAGERSGQLAETLTLLEEETLRRIRNARGGAWSTVYLLGILGGCAMLGAFNLVKVIPVFREIMVDFGMTVPVRTIAPGLLPGMGDDAVLLIFSVLGALVVGAALLRVYTLQAGFRGSWLARHFPVLNRAARLHDFQLVSRLIVRELEAGLPLTDALDHAAAAARLPRVRKAFLRVGDRVRQGESLSDAIAEQPRVFDIAAFPSYVALGEQSGRLPDALMQAADLYEAHLKTRSDASETLMRCAAVITVALLAFFVVESMYALIVDVTHGAIEQI